MFYPYIHGDIRPGMVCILDGGLGAEVLRVEVVDLDDDLDIIWVRFEGDSEVHRTSLLEFVEAFEALAPSLEDLDEARMRGKKAYWRRLRSFANTPPDFMRE